MRPEPEDISRIKMFFFYKCVSLNRINFFFKCFSQYLQKIFKEYIHTSECCVIAVEFHQHEHMEIKNIIDELMILSMRDQFQILAFHRLQRRICIKTFFNLSISSSLENFHRRSLFRFFFCHTGFAIHYFH